MRVKYNSGELDYNHKIIEGIRSTLAASQTRPRRALTDIQAVAKMDLDEDGKEASLDQKINHICKTLDCTHERIGNEIVFCDGEQKRN